MSPRDDLRDELQPFFGEPWPSGICDEGRRVPTPVGKACLLCAVPIQDDDQGSFVYAQTGAEPVHKECSLRSVLGGIGHLSDHDHWCTRMGDPDGGKSYRESALAVWDWTRRHSPMPPRWQPTQRDHAAQA